MRKILKRVLVGWLIYEVLLVVTLVGLYQTGHGDAYFAVARHAPSAAASVARLVFASSFMRAAGF